MEKIRIIFDGDDTLWQTEALYDQARDQVAHLISQKGLGAPSVIVEQAKMIDLENAQTQGVKKDRFANSMKETSKFFATSLIQIDHLAMPMKSS